MGWYPVFGYQQGIIYALISIGLLVKVVIHYEVFIRDNRIWT